MLHALDAPKGFSRQPICDEGLVAIASKSALSLNNRLRSSPGSPESLLLESYDKRYSPSTFLSESVPGRREGFYVGWFSLKGGYECVQEHERLYDAATDYVLFSLGLGRWRSTDLRPIASL